METVFRALFLTDFSARAVSVVMRCHNRAGARDLEVEQFSGDGRHWKQDSGAYQYGRVEC